MHKRKESLNVQLFLVAVLEVNKTLKS